VRYPESQRGIDVLFVGDKKRGAEDERIVREAKEGDRIIVTCDKDFGFLALLQGPLASWCSGPGARIPLPR